MGFFNTSAVTAKTVKQGLSAVATAQQSVSTVISSPPTSVKNSITTTINGSSGGLSSTISKVNGGIGTAVAAEAAISKIIGGEASNFLQSALRSINSTFDKTAKGLATSVSGSLVGIFQDKNNRSASTTATNISDPVTTNLLKSKPPTSSTFKVDSLQSGSQLVTMSGSSSTFGSGDLSMVGTNLSTLLDRFDLDAISSLPTTVASSLSSDKVNGLFTKTPTNVTSAISPKVSSGIFGKSLGDLNSLSVNATALTGNVSDVAKLSQSNDFQTFIGQTSTLTKFTGIKDVSSYFLANPDYSLVNNSGVPVDTNRSGIDAGTANSILSLLKIAGCSLTNTNYNSANLQSSIFNIGLSSAAQGGMINEVTNLLGCSQASSPLGQQSLISSFVSTIGSQLGISRTILGSIQSPSTVNTPFVRENLITNSSLTASDAPTVRSILTDIGSSVEESITLPGTTTSPYPVYDARLLATAQPSFVKEIMGDNTFSDFIVGVPLNINPDGKLAIA